MGKVVYANMTGWAGDTLYLQDGEPWDADDPVVKTNPQFFTAALGEHMIRRTPTNPIEQATAAPGEQRDVAAPQEPPRSGAGSGRDAWAAYAESQGVEVTEDMTRDDIIEAAGA